jgi:translation initiation factor IF-2
MKVRIYDLARELKRENRDILDICERLNIAFKSHSSTISESDAERVKAMAEKYGPSRPRSQPRERGKEEAVAPKERKQEILAVHHRQPSEVSSAAVPALASPPSRSPQKSHQLISPPKLTAPSSSQPAPPIEESPQLQPPKVTEAAPAPLELPSSQLHQPPTPAGKKAAAAPKADETAAAKPAKLRKGRPARQAEKPAEIAPQVPQLKAPPRLKPDLPAASAAVPVSEENEGMREGIEVLEIGDKESQRKPAKKLKLSLNRPTPPRQQRAVVVEEEERESKEGKLGKAAAKGKRRQKNLIEEEDDEALLAASAALLPSSVSISIARPPKPQSLMKQPTTPTSKPRKAPTKGERPRAERRERAEIQQRPESIILETSLTVRELADQLKVPETEIIKNLFFKGIPVNITQTLEVETARLVAEELGVAVETVVSLAAATKTTEMLDVGDLEKLQHRPPVVTIMGHVDHGKTTLLDSIRQTKVAQGEAGGITQHIGAYHVDLEHNGKPEQIVFLDTPGHEAFTAMRARGAKVTDIAVLVVAADDGVRPQTQEAISHARAAEVPIVVAINKIDKASANPDRVKQELSELGLVPEDWGGDTIMVPVSALKGDNLDNLLEMLLLVAEMQELSANPDRSARGTVIEANLDRTRGPVATLLVQNGTLRVGDAIVAGSVFGKIRAMIDDRGARVEATLPSFAVEILGLSEVPAAGDEFEVFSDEREARTTAELRAADRHQTRLQQAMASRRVTLSSLSAQAQEGELKELNLILKADVQGSVEALLGALQQLPQDQVQVRVLLGAAGEITETDVDLAAASGAVIVGFNTTLASGARQAADREGVDIREYDIIYKLLDDIQGAMEGLLEPEEIESPLGQAEVRALFPIGRGVIAGSYVQSGKIVRNRNLRVRRGGKVIYEGVVDSLKRIKEDAREVNAGFECGIGTAKFNNWQEGDIIEVYEMVMKRRTLNQ